MVKSTWSFGDTIYLNTGLIIGDLFLSLSEKSFCTFQLNLFQFKNKNVSQDFFFPNLY